MRRGALLIIPWAALLSIGAKGCFLDHIGGGSSYSDDDVTPAGWHVLWQDQGTLATGLHTKAQVYDLFDAAIVRASQHYAAKYNLPAQAYLDGLRHYGVGFTLIDNARFPVQGRAVDFPDAAYATGETLGPAVTLAFYDDHSTATGAPPFSGSPAWTWRQAINGTWYYGLEDSGAQYPALEYETFVNILGLTW